MASIAVVLGSVRPGRAGEQVVRWIEEQALQVEGVNPIFIDLRDYDLPLFAEEMSPSMQAPTLPEAVRLRANIEALDAVVFVTPEYNQSIPGVLKNAIDYLPPAAMDGKKIGLVGYSWHSAASALAHLRPATLKDKATALIGYSWYGGEAPRAHLRDILSTFGADVREQELGINLGSDFVDGAFKPSDELSASLRQLLASLA